MWETNLRSYHLHTPVIEEVLLACCLPLLCSGDFKHVVSLAGPPYDAEEHSTSYLHDTAENTYPMRPNTEHRAYARLQARCHTAFRERVDAECSPLKAISGWKSHSSAWIYLHTFVPPFIVGVTSCGALVLTGDNRDRRRQRGKERIVGHLAHYIQTLILLFICTECMWAGDKFLSIWNNISRAPRRSASRCNRLTFTELVELANSWHILIYTRAWELVS